jgi:hypothetical protein
MTKYNVYAKQLDAAFRTARDEYAKSYAELQAAQQANEDAGAWRPDDDAANKQLRVATTALELNKAEAAFKITETKVWPEFDAKCKELRKELEKDVQKDGLANPDAIDANTVELLKAGVLTVEDYYSLAERYEGNSTMLRLLGKYALDESIASGDIKEAAALRMLSDNCKNGAGAVLRAWNELEGLASYCSGRGGNRNAATSPDMVVSMGKWWEELAGQAIENF